MGSRCTHSLNTASPNRVVQDYIFSCDIFDNIDLAWILANRAHSKAQSIVECAVCNIDVCRVLLHADRVISVVNDPAQERDVVGIDSLQSQVSNYHVRHVRQGGSYIHSVRIHDAPKVAPRPRCAIHVDVLEKHAF